MRPRSCQSYLCFWFCLLISSSLHKMKWNIFIFSTYSLQLHKCTKVIQNKLRSKWKSSFFFSSVLLFFFFPPPKKEVICFNLWKWVLRTIKLRMDSFLNLGYRAIFYRSLLKWVSFEMCPLWLDLASMYYNGLRAFFIAWVEEWRLSNYSLFYIV